MLHEDQPNVVLLHTSSIDLNNQTKGKINTEILKENIINIGKHCINFGVKEVIISLIVPKNNITLTRLIRQVNSSLREQ